MGNLVAWRRRDSNGYIQRMVRKADSEGKLNQTKLNQKTEAWHEESALTTGEGSRKARGCCTMRAENVLFGEGENKLGDSFRPGQ